MWAEQIILAVIGLSSGAVVAGGLFAFLIELGVIADFADRTHTADHLLLYEDAAALGGIVGNLFFSMFRFRLDGGCCRCSDCSRGCLSAAGRWRWRRS